jgi:hypothetical protein
MESIELQGLFWIKFMGAVLVTATVLYPIGFIVIGGYLKTRKQRKGK